MKKESLILMTMQVWSWALMSGTLLAIGYALIQLVTGNYSATACREF
jgi:hypothetical protein